MAQVTVIFHPSVDLPPYAKALPGAVVSIEASWSVRQFGLAVERLCAANGAGVRVCALINPARRCAAPPHESAAEHFQNGDRAVVIGDIAPTPWPSVEASASRRPAGSPVPITIFTGFLGSGKTTVLNHLLQGQRDKKFAVIENEFGEVPIDNELLASNLGLAEQVIVMENGCMCCTVRGDLLGAFDAIRKQTDKGSPLDAVLVETTGMADPVPIVRTLRTTPDIAKYFQLDGVITLVDSKTILDRLAETTEENQERHRQIAFADKILLNKVDLVNDEDAVTVWRQIRSFNATCPVVSCVKGIVPAAELTNLGAFDLAKIVEEEAPGHGHGHEGHGHGGHGHHECDESCDHGHGGGHSQDGDENMGHVGGHGHGHNHSRHDTEIGSFSIVRHDMEVDPLTFARWVRAIATLPEEQGKLYRSKGVVAVAGKLQKLIFHAVADVVETLDGPEWGDNENRCCKMVFIGKKLDKKQLSERYLALLRPVKKQLREFCPSARGYRRTTLQTLSERGALCQCLLRCWSKDVLRVAQASPAFHDALFGPAALAHFQAAACTLPLGHPRGAHTVDGNLWLHALLPVSAIKRYAISFRDSQIKLNTASSKDYLYGEPLWFDTTADVEAMAITAQELVELADKVTRNFLVEFKWRPETMKAFFLMLREAPPIRR
jgi:G3E family GTPase